MCRSSNMNAYALQAPMDAGAIGLHDLTASLSSCTNAIVTATTSSSSGAQPSTQNKGRKHSSRHPHIVVEHHYHDHANEHDLVDERPARGGVTTPFPIRLHKMLDKMEADGHGDVISWQPHGRCFVVRKPKEFKELLPIYFKLSKMASFQRQLNLYGFQRLTRGRDKNGTYKVVLICMCFTAWNQHYTHALSSSFSSNQVTTTNTFFAEDQLCPTRFNAPRSREPAFVLVRVLPRNLTYGKCRGLEPRRIRRPNTTRTTMMMLEVFPHRKMRRTTTLELPKPVLLCPSRNKLPWPVWQEVWDLFPLLPPCLRSLLRHLCPP